MTDNRTIAIVPAYEPGKSLIDLVDRLREIFAGVVVVDDGSHASAAVFDGLRDDGKRVILLHHDRNRGKGAALKTAFAEVLRRFPSAGGVVTVDADGQHLVEDVTRVVEALHAAPERLALGVRTFSADIPFRSRLGNLWTIAEFRLLTGHTVHDTQSGLRAIPLALVPRLAAIPGERYEYEIRMLVAAAVSCGITEVPIGTVYLENNRSSHFRPLVDTCRTQWALWSAALAERL